jgi:hypothetical protein
VQGPRGHTLFPYPSYVTVGGEGAPVSSSIASVVYTT